MVGLSFSEMKNVLNICDIVNNSEKRQLQAFIRTANGKTIKHLIAIVYNCVKVKSKVFASDDFKADREELKNTLKARQASLRIITNDKNSLKKRREELVRLNVVLKPLTKLVGFELRKVVGDD